MQASSQPATRAGLLDRCGAQIGARLDNAASPRPLAIVKWICRLKTKSPLLDLRTMRILVLHDHSVEADVSRIRFAGYWCHSIPEGVLLGGAAGMRFEKNLALAPRSGAQRGSRIDLSDVPFLRTALNLDSRLSDAARDPTARFPNTLRLPSLWAAFRPEIAASLRGSGPELCGLCHELGQSSAELLRRFRRLHHGLVLFPHEWMSEHWSEAKAIYADFAGVPRCQTVDCSEGFAALQGYRAASEFNFIESRFSSRHGRRRSAPRLTMAVAG